ncbi:MAG: aminoglycoside 3'-phosphotransferase [Clostridia bacterium]|nr:aminoglycoside 3'-phosphotransferase [Clostridia bacterium]
MKQTHVSALPADLPAALRSLLDGAELFDSSSSPAARVWHISGKEDCYLKRAGPGALAREAEMTRWMHRKGMAAEVLHYFSGESDWLVTGALSGKDGIAGEYRSDPRRLCLRMAELMRELHQSETAGCPIQNRTGEYLETVWRGIGQGVWKPSLTVAGRFPWKNREEAADAVREYGTHLARNTLIHGDFCLPNVILNGWRFSGYIDLDSGGVGDRHIDLYWMMWSLTFNLKDGGWADMFLDAYGKENVEPELLRAVAACECFG